MPALGRIIQKISPARRTTTLKEVTDYIVFLYSPSAIYINGTSLMIDAGLTIITHGATAFVRRSKEGGIGVKRL